MIPPTGYQLPYFQSNFILNRDFIITAEDNDLVFTAKRTGLGFNMVTYNVTPGVAEIMKPNHGVVFNLYLENADHTGFDLIYEATLATVIGTEITAEAIIDDKLNDNITAEILNNLPDTPTTDPILCKKSCRQYYFEFAECWGEPLQIRKLFTSNRYTVIHGGMSYLGQGTKNIIDLIAPGIAANDTFLKQGLTLTHTRTDQPQYIFFVNTRTLTQITLVAKFYFKDGSIANQTIGDYNLPQYRKAGFNVQFDQIFNPDDYPLKTVQKFELYLENNVAERISQSWWYELDYSFKSHYRYFLYWSSWGTLDSKMFYGKRSVEFDLVQQEAERANHNPNDIAKGKSLVFDSKITTKFSATTGFQKNKTELIYNRDFYLSVLKWSIYNGDWLPIKITSKTIEEIQDGNNLYAQKFEYEYAFDDSAYTEGDVATPEVTPPRILGQVYFGPSISRPETEVDVLSLPNSISPEVYLIPLYTGTNRIFSIALPFGKLLGSVYDQTSDENLTSEYNLAGTIVVDEINYRIHIMEMAIPYSINHDHIITIINE